MRKFFALLMVFLMVSPAVLGQGTASAPAAPAGGVVPSFPTGPGDEPPAAAVRETASGYFSEAARIAGSQQPSHEEGVELAEAIVAYFDANPTADIDGTFGEGTGDVVSAARALAAEPSDPDESLFYGFLNAASGAKIESPEAPVGGVVPSFSGIAVGAESGGVPISVSNEYVFDASTGKTISIEQARQQIATARGIDVSDVTDEMLYGTPAAAGPYGRMSSALVNWIRDSGAQPYQVRPNDPFFPGMPPNAWVWYTSSTTKSTEPGYFFNNLQTNTLNARTSENNIVVWEHTLDLDIDGEAVPNSDVVRQFRFNAEGTRYSTTDASFQNGNLVGLTYEDSNIAGRRHIVIFNADLETVNIDGHEVTAATQRGEPIFEGMYDPTEQKYYDEDGAEITDAAAIARIEKEIKKTPYGWNMQMNADLYHSRNVINAWVRLFTYRPFAAIATIIEGYQLARGLRWMYGWIGGFSDEDVQVRKEKIKQDFCPAGGISRCFSSLICDWQLEGRIDWQPQGGLVVRSSGGLPEFGVFVNGYKIGPIELRGASTDTLKALFGNFTVIEGKFYNFTDLDFDTYDLPANKKAFLYQVNYYVSNVVGSRGMGGGIGGMDFRPAVKQLHWNLEWKGPYTARWFPSDQVLQGGQNTDGNLFKYSFNDYGNICVTLDPPIDSGDPADRESYSQICNVFVAYAGDEDSLGGTAPPLTTAVSGIPGGAV